MLSAPGSYEVDFEPQHRPVHGRGHGRPLRRGPRRSRARSTSPTAPATPRRCSSTPTRAPGRRPTAQFRLVVVCSGEAKRGALLESAPVSGFRPVDPKQSFPELELGVLERWRADGTFERQLAQRRDAGAPVWSFNDGPPTANGKPGSHHVLSRPSRTSIPATRRCAATTCPQGRLGLPRAPGRARDREGARDLVEGRDRGLRDRGVQSALPGVRAALRRGLEPAHRADRLLDRPRRPLRHDDHRLHRVGLVVAAADLGRRSPLRGPQGRPRTARAAARRFPRTRSRRATRTSRTRPSTCASRSLEAPRTTRSRSRR